MGGGKKKSSSLPTNKESLTGGLYGTGTAGGKQYI